KYNQEYPEFKLKLILNEYNMGGAESRNIGVQHSNAEYITFLDDDDEYLNEKILNQLKFMQKFNYDLTFSNLIIKKDSNIVDFREYSWLESFSNEYLLKAHLLYHLTGTPTFMFNRKEFLNIGGFP